METVFDCATEVKAHGTLYHREKRQAIRLGCNRWNCKTCGPRKARRSQKRMRTVNWKKLITVTMPPGHGWPARENLKYQAEHLRSFLTALKRRYGAFPYAWVREIGKARPDCVCLKESRARRPDENKEVCPDAGEVPALLDCICGAGGSRLHLHMLVDIAPWIDGRWLNAMAARCRLGFVDIRAIRGSLTEYVTKYLAKGWASPFPARARRVQFAGVAALEPEPGWRFWPMSIQWTVAWWFDGIWIEKAIAFWSLDPAG